MHTTYKSLNDALLAAHTFAPDKGYVFLEKDGPVKLTYKELYEQAHYKARQLNSVGIGLDSRVLFIMDKSAQFAIAYYALLLCGAVPCVLPPMGNSRNSQIASEKLNHIAVTIKATHVIGSQEDFNEVLNAQYINVANLNFEPNSDFEVKHNETAFFQTSSGTTGKPKCIALTQENILTNAEQIRKRLDVTFTGDDVMVNWLPLHHDMGLVGCFLSVMYWQIDCVQMTAFQFLRKPELWLQAISDYKGTLSTVPNFAYALATNKVSDSVIETLDLSSWRSAMCGAEQIDYRVLEKFAKRFNKCGFNPKAITPCYGLAETTLCVSMHVPGNKITYEHLTRKELTRDRKAVLAESGENSVTVVDCGKPVEGTELQIRDDVGKVLEEGQLGELWVSGPSVIDGYFGLPEETRMKFVNGWFNSGDLAYLRNGHLFITGRKKELIIIRGHNYAPTEFEWIASEVSGVASGKVVAFGLFDEASATESLYLAFERDKKLGKEQSDAALAESVKLHIAKKLGALAIVEVLPKNTITKTTSGKLQRTKVAEMFAMRELA